MVSINSRDAETAARAYAAMDWPLAVGHQFQPEQGCTCGRQDCPIPGAHPVVGAGPMDEASLLAALDASPDAGLIARTEGFDAVLVPRDVGMAAMVYLDRETPVACLVMAPDTYGLLVAPSTGRYAAVDPAVEVRTGEDGWIALPPSHGTRWDNSPWIEGTTVPRALISGHEIRHALADCFMVVGAGALR